jgi:hypothetical protein
LRPRSLCFIPLPCSWLRPGAASYHEKSALTAFKRRRNGFVMQVLATVSEPLNRSAFLTVEVMCRVSPIWNTGLSWITFASCGFPIYVVYHVRVAQQFWMGCIFARRGATNLSSWRSIQWYARQLQVAVEVVATVSKTRSCLFS